jgi:uncharacterized protein YhjY with autotransporter beta-barrel domain
VAAASGAAAQIPCKPDEEGGSGRPTTVDQVVVQMLDRTEAPRGQSDQFASDDIREFAAATRAATETSLALDTERRGEICGNLRSGLQTTVVQPGITVVSTASFTGAITSRLDTVRGQAGAGGTAATANTPPDGLMGLGGPKTRAPRPTRASPLTVYAIGTFLGGSRGDAPDQIGFDYGAGSGTIGVEYSVDRHLILGLAGNYTGTSADVTGGATVDASAIQGAAYLSYATKQWYFDLLAAYGSHELDLKRPGLTEPVFGSTGADAFAVAARSGYLFDFGGVRAGPIAGLTWVHARVGGYTETGDRQVTLDVSALTLDSFAGSVGIRFLAPFRAGGNLFVPYLNVTLEHRFGDLDQVLTASLTSAPPGGAPVSAAFPVFDARDFGKIEGGVTLELGPDLSASLSGASTFARDESYDFRVSGGLTYRF